MEFRILGPLDVTGAALGGPRPRSVLAYLLLHANEAVPSERLIDELWAGEPPATAAKVVQNAVAALRRELGRDRIATHGTGYELRVGEGELDAARFEQLVRDARARPAEAASLLREADGLWRGQALADFSYEGWAQPHAYRLEELRLAAVEDRIDAELAGGAAGELVGELRVLVDAQPLRERFRAQLMLALYRAGRQAEALEAYRDARRALLDELGIEPGEPLQQLEKAILVHDPALEHVASAPAEPAAAAAAGSGELVRKRATLLLATVRATARDPEAAMPAAARASEAATRILERHGASVEPAGADAVLATFGLLELNEDDGVRALRAAAELATALRDEPGVEVRLATDAVDVIAPEGAAAAGAHAGAAIADLRALAASVEAGETAVGDALAALVRSSVRLTGANVLVEVPPDARAIPRRLDAPLVGRGRELDALLEEFRAARAERSCRLALVVGPAGIGKSRLAGELRAVVERDALVLVGRCSPFGEQRASQPLAELVAGAAGGTSVALLVEALGDVPGAPMLAETIAAATGGGDAPSAPAETYRAVRRLLERVARDRPLVVVVDDLHWGDALLVGLVDHLASLSAGAPILLVVLARPELLETHAELAAGPNARTLALEPLDAGDSAHLVSNLLGRAALADDARTHIVAAAEGNPLFLEQIVSTLIDEGALRRSGRRWIAADDIVRRPLPPTIQALLAARLDRLAPEERRTLQIAAILGPQAWTGAVAALAALDEPAAAELLERLVRKDLLRPAPSAMPGDDAFAFRHGLVREAAYASVPKAVRAALHERAAEWLPADADEQVGLHLERAHGYRIELGERGEDVDDLAARAAERLYLAGEDAFAREATAAAVSLFERAAALRPAGSLERGETLVLLAEALIVRGDFAAARAAVDESIAGARAHGEELLELRARAAGVRVSIRQEPSLEDVAREADALVAGFERYGDERGLARAHALVGAVVKWLGGDAGGAAASARRSIEHARRAGDLETEARGWRTLLGAALFGPTPVDEGIALCAETVERFGDRRPLTTATAYRAWAGLAAMAGRFDDAATFVERDRALLAELGLGPLRIHTAQVEAWVGFRAGDPVAAEAAARDGLAFAEEFNDQLVIAEFAALVARALELQGSDEEALRLTELAERSSQRGDVAVDVQWRIARAPALARSGEPEAAVELAREAVSAAAATDFLPLRADALACLASLLLADDPAAAAEVAREAQALYAAKGDLAGARRLEAVLA